jgi:hypothetical protein
MAWCNVLPATVTVWDTLAGRVPFSTHRDEVAFKAEPSIGIYRLTTLIALGRASRDKSSVRTNRIEAHQIGRAPTRCHGQRP